MELDPACHRRLPPGGWWWHSAREEGPGVRSVKQLPSARRRLSSFFHWEGHFFS